MSEKHDRDEQASPVSGGAGAGSVHGGHAGSGMGLSEESRERAQTDELARSVDEAVASRPGAQPKTRPTGVPSASRTRRSSGIRGTGGGLGDAAGGARKATAAEMTGNTASIGDTPIEPPRGGSKTDGAAQGGGLSRGTADPAPPESADPSAGSGIAGRPPQRSGAASGDRSETGLGDSGSGGPLKDYDGALRDRD